MKTIKTFVPLLRYFILTTLLCARFILFGQGSIKQIGPEYISAPNDACFAANGRIFLSTQGGIFSSDNGGEQWKKINSSFNNVYFNAPVFAKSKDGKIYTCNLWNSNTVYFTADNGLTWKDWFLFFLPSPFSPINSFVPQNDTLFVAMKAGLGFAIKENPLVEPFPQFNTKNIVRVEVEGNSILAIGSDSKVYLSVDRGVTWTNNPDLPFTIDDGPLKRFDRKGNVLVTVAKNSDFWISADFGKNWTIKNTGLPAPALNLSDLQIDGNEVFVANGNNIFKSSLDLSGWQAIFTSVPYHATNFISVQGNQAFIGGNQTLIKTSDRGLTWTPSSIKGIYDARFEYFSANTTDGSLLAFGGSGMFKKKKSDNRFIHFADIHNQAIVEGNVIYTGGSTIATWSGIDGSIISQSPIIPNSFTWSSADEVNHIKDQFFVSLPSKGIWKLTKQNVWQEFNAGFKTFNSNRIQTIDTLIYAISDNALYKSGITIPKWVKVDNGSPSPISVYAIKDSIIVTGSVYNECYISKDKGATWKQIGKSILDNGQTAFFFDKKNLMVSTYNNFYLTKDLGETWTKATLIDSLRYPLFIQSIYATEDSVYLGTNENGILSFSKGLIEKVNQVITFSPLPNRTFGDAVFTLSATTTSGLPLSFSSSDETKVTISGSNVTIVGAGSVTITAKQVGNANYNAATDVTQVLTIGKANQTITFNSLPVKTLGNTSFNLTASSSSALSIQYSSTSDKVSLSGNEVTMMKAGSVTIKADQSGNDNYAAAISVSQSFCINPAKPVITTTGLNSGTPVLTSSSSNGNQWFKNGTLIADAISNTFTPTEGGTYSVKVTVDNCSSELSAEQILIITGDLNSAIESDFFVYPNPVTSSLTASLINFDSNSNVEIVIYDPSGRTIEKTYKQGDKAVVSVSSYLNGIYFISATQHNKTLVAKFVKE